MPFPLLFLCWESLLVRRLIVSNIIIISFEDSVTHYMHGGTELEQFSKRKTSTRKKEYLYEKMNTTGQFQRIVLEFCGV